MTLKGRSKAARAKKLSENVSYRVCVVGTTWQGFTSTYDYTFANEPSTEEIHRKAGDFQAITDYETMRVTHIQYSDGDRRIIKVIRPWDSTENCIIACELRGC